MQNMDIIITGQRGRLAHLKNMLTLFEKKAKTEKTRGLAQSYIDEIEVIHQKFKDDHEHLCDILRESSIQSDDVPYMKDDVFFIFCDIFLSFKGKLLDLLNELKNPLTPNFHSSTMHMPSNSRNDSVCTEARLPKIDIPKFSGDYLEWISYRDMFVSLVHNNQSLSKVQKYYFLKGSCSSTPLNIINEYPASDASYELAWSALQQRYHNKRKIVDTLLKKLFAIPNANGSFESIKLVLGTTRNCLALLSTMDVSTDNWDVILIYITTNKLDAQSRKEWEQSLKASTEIPSVNKLFEFLETTFRTLETINDQRASTTYSSSAAVKSSKPYLSSRQPLQRNAFLTTRTASNDDNCPCCEKRHMLYKCFKFASLPAAAKRDLIQKRKICRNCLTMGHFASHCRLASRCHVCQQPHHTILHNDYAINNANSCSEYPHSNSTNNRSPNLNCNISSLDVPTAPQVLLATIRVIVKTSKGNFFLRALLDQAAQASFITEDAVQTLQLQKCDTFARINGIGGKSTFTARKYVNMSLASAHNNKYQIECSALVLPSLTAYKPLPININTLPNLTQLSLADPNFLESSKIDLILGGDIYGGIVLPQQKKYDNGVFLQNTNFGWVVSGPTNKITYGHDINANICSLDELLRSFWEQEELTEIKSATREEAACEQHFKNTHFRDGTGRYTVALPFKSQLLGLSIPQFQHTDYNALRRLKQMECRFLQQPTFAHEYRLFMREYEELGHMKRVGIYPRDLKPNSFFLPHHGVLKESSTTTKLRIVFDGSVKRPPQSSLNEELSPGPALQNDLPSIITRWRRFKVGFRADLEKMFRQIRVYEDQQNYQQILWRNSMADDIGIYQLCTVTYGTTSAPYLSIRVLQQLAEDEQTVFPAACGVLKTDTYVDDVISGADSFEEARDLQLQLCKLLEAGCFNLRKWTSNSFELVNSIPQALRETSTKFELNDTNVVKALGLQWETVSDSFSFTTNFGKCDKVTKCSVLSDSAKLYDPLGWLAPVTIRAKIIFQKLWLVGLDWHDELPNDLKTEWIKYRNALNSLESISIPRWICCDKNSTLEIHGFCDASQVAYAAVVFVKVVESKECGYVNMMQSKTKVAPLKTVTLPRLELCGASLLVKLVRKICIQLARAISNIVFWTDSMTVLSWIRGESSRWSIYVGNRVAEIQRSSDPTQWRYIPTRDNPADCASRGISAEDLHLHKLWWTGPEWLSQPAENWPKQPILKSTSLEARKAKIMTHITTSSKEIEYPELLTRFSSLNKLVRVVAYIFRFMANTQLYKEKAGGANSAKKSGFLKTCELKHSLRRLVKCAQETDFVAEITELKKSRALKSSSAIARLCPFIDSDGLLRVGGRIQNADCDYSRKHPILLKKQNPLSVLIFRSAHHSTMHGGVQQMQSYVGNTYWVLSARNLAKSILHRCVTCFKYNAKATQQLMGNLPSARLQPTRAFKHSGVDYAGPIIIKQSTARNTITSKGYICLFVCMVTKALHLEAVTSLSTDAFLAAFRRFVARRGACTDLYSDCGTNFIGANKELQILNNRCAATLPEELVATLANTATTWHFIPPASPNFGGLWEAGVKSTKYHLRRVMNDRILTYEELSTLLAQIESCLNSRPLCPLSTDPQDIGALTPSHFLIGEPTICVPDDNLLETNFDQLSRWKVIERLKQQFWKRWKCEYLSRLQARPKWLKINRNAEVGDLVLIYDERCPPGQWPLARVQKVHPGADGCVRVVTLYTRGKELKRPISKVVFLPINEQFSTISPRVSEDASPMPDRSLAVSRGIAKSTRRQN